MAFRTMQLSAKTDSALTKWGTKTITLYHRTTRNAGTTKCEALT